MFKIRSLWALALLLAIPVMVALGCSTGSPVHAPASVPAVTLPNPSGSFSGPVGNVTLAFQIARPGSPAANTRSPKYLPQWTTSVAISINGGTAQVVTVPGTACTATGSVYTCTVSLTAPLGSDTFTVTASDTNGYVLSAATSTLTVTNSQNTVQASAGLIPAQFKFTQSTPGQDGCPIAGTGQTSTFNYVTYDADYITTASDSAALTGSTNLATSYSIYNDGGVGSFQSAATGGTSITGATPSLPVSVGAGSVTATYSTGTGMTTFTMYGPDAFAYNSGALTTLYTRGSNFNITPLSNTGSYHGHYVFVNNTSNSGGATTDIWDVCKRSYTGPDSTLPAPASTPLIQGPVVLDTNTQHFFQLYLNSAGTSGAVGFFDYTYPNFTPGSNTPPQIGGYYQIPSGTPQAIAYSSSGFLFVTASSPALLYKLAVNEGTGLSSAALTSTGLTVPAGVALGNSHVFVADSSANLVAYYSGTSLAAQGLFMGTGMVNSPYYLASSLDGNWVAVAAYPAASQIPVIATSGPSLAVTLNTSLPAVGISWTSTGSSATCSSASNTGSGVLTVLEQSGSTYQVEIFGGFSAGGSYTGAGSTCLTSGGGSSTISGSLLSTNTWIDAGSRIMGAIFVAGTYNGGLNQNLQAPGTESWRAINRGNGISAWTRSVNTNSSNAATITASE